MTTSGSAASWCTEKRSSRRPAACSALARARSRSHEAASRCQRAPSISTISPATAEGVDSVAATGDDQQCIPLRLRQAGPAQQIAERGLAGRSGASDHRLQGLVQQPAAPPRAVGGQRDQLREGDQVPLDGIGHERPYVVPLPGGDGHVQDRACCRRTGNPPPPIARQRLDGLMDQDEAVWSQVPAVDDGDMHARFGHPQPVQSRRTDMAQDCSSAGIGQGRPPTLPLRQRPAVADHHPR